LAVIEVGELGKRYEEVWGIIDVNFTVKEGELAVLVGPNGAGKTTTIRILTTFLKPSKARASFLSTLTHQSLGALG
jgi:ABC-type multidrug transport system ATPase subunit